MPHKRMIVLVMVWLSPPHAAADPDRLTDMTVFSHILLHCAQHILSELSVMLFFSMRFQ